MRYSFIFVLVLCFYSSYSYSEVDGKSMLRDCRTYLHIDETGKERVDFMRAGHCLGFVYGMLQMNDYYDYRYNKIYKRSGDGNAPAFCQPAGVDIDKSIKFVVRHLEDKPEDLHHPAGVLTLRALHKAYPC